MCGRFVVYSNSPFGLKYKISYNISPSQLIPIKIKGGFKLLKWSYSPTWNKDMNLINCRFETMNEKPSYKNAERCIIFHDGWYEWKKNNSEKIPYYHYSESNYFAGLYNDSGCLIVTRSATHNIKKIHHRQPVLLWPNELLRYLDGENIFDSNANIKVNYHPVSNYVNNPLNNNSSLIEEVI
jgi:putative SOS response-associated peptidase YedK